MSERVPPKRLYKYRSFSNLTLGMLVNDTVYFADPTTFNDPLDTKPTLDTDLPSAALEPVLAQMIEERTTAEMAAAAKTIRYKGPKTLDHIARQSRKAAERLLADIRYNATNPEYEVADPEQFLLGQYVQEELLRRYDRGVFSLAERVNCPLMWSHYGDQHHGICLGYSVPDDVAVDIHKMKYGGSRLVQASAVSAMLAGDSAARRGVDEAVLLRKARPWAYEREWRLLGPRGEQHSPLELEEVIFGLRCSSAVMFAVIRALEGRDRPVRFYEIRGQHGRFLLDKRVADTTELLATHPRRHRGIFEIFSEFEKFDVAAPYKGTGSSPSGVLASGIKLRRAVLAATDLPLRQPLWNTALPWVGIVPAQLTEGIQIKPERLQITWRMNGNMTFVLGRDRAP